LDRVAYAALPLVLHILDVKLATKIHQARKQKRLKVYSETMKVFKSQYDVTEEVSDIIATMINYVSVEQPIQQSQFTITGDDASSSAQSKHVRSGAMSSVVIPTKALSVVNDWGSVLLRQPNLYLRFALTIDLALDRGHFPDDSDFPIALQWRNTTTTRFPMYKITVGDMQYQSDSNVEAEKRVCGNQNVIVSNDMQNHEHTTNSESRHVSPISMSPSTNAFIDQMMSMTEQSENHQNDDLGVAMDFGDFEVAGLTEGDEGFNYAATWPEESFLTHN
jgi:hypothetical protein